MAMYLCTCGEWVSSTDNHQCKLNPFNVIMNDEDKKGGKSMYNNVKELKIFLIDMAHDIETDDEKLAEDLRRMAATL